MAGLLFMRLASPVSEESPPVGRVSTGTVAQEQDLAPIKKGMAVRNATLRAVMVALGLVASVFGQSQVLVSTDITTSTTWTANNVYNLQNQIFVQPGATLTIEAGTVIASTTNIGGSLAVCRGAQIFVLGNEKQPVVFTSAADRATWTGGNPRTGRWRAAANEWGNLTIMGAAYISENAVGGNVATLNANNTGVMEGLTAPSWVTPATSMAAATTTMTRARSVTPHSATAGR